MNDTDKRISPDPWRPGSSGTAGPTADMDTDKRIDALEKKLSAIVEAVLAFTGDRPDSLQQTEPHLDRLMASLYQAVRPLRDSAPQT